MFTRKSKSGFTLVEILIVVIILGILAAIVIPQFTNASQDARRSSLASQLQTLRSQIELWKLQHGDTLPDLVGGTTGSDTTNWDDLTTITVYQGQNFGPYMQAPPSNPLNNSTTVVDGDGSDPAYVPAAGVGFVYDVTGGTGRIHGVDETGASPVIFVE
jgi:general secretion pathway protein G